MEGDNINFGPEETHSEIINQPEEPHKKSRRRRSRRRKSQAPVLPVVEGPEVLPSPAQDVNLPKAEGLADHISTVLEEYRDKWQKDTLPSENYQNEADQQPSVGQSVEDTTASVNQEPTKAIAIENEYEREIYSRDVTSAHQDLPEINYVPDQSIPNQASSDYSEEPDSHEETAVQPPQIDPLIAHSDERVNYNQMINPNDPIEIPNPDYQPSIDQRPTVAEPIPQPVTPNTQPNNYRYDAPRPVQNLVMPPPIKSDKVQERSSPQEFNNQLNNQTIQLESLKQTEYDNNRQLEALRSQNDELVSRLVTQPETEAQTQPKSLEKPLDMPVMPQPRPAIQEKPELTLPKPVEKDLPPDHRLDKSTWHNIEVDRKTGRPAESPVFDYGQEFANERQQEMLSPGGDEEVAVASGQLAVGSEADIDVSSSATKPAPTTRDESFLDQANQFKETITGNFTTDMWLWIILALVIVADLAAIFG